MTGGGPRAAVEQCGRDLAATSLALARRFAAGATLWCCAPAWPHHARHVAVEFVHPVIVGKRALPAISVEERDLVAELRASVRPGDVVLAVADAGEPMVLDTMQRSPAWGASTVWIGAGRRPDPGRADHVVWLDDAPRAAFDGQFILLYHVLWELTHVCFEHPGLLRPRDDGAGATCVTCADEGHLGEVVSGDEAEALVRTACGVESVDVTLVGPVDADDLVLVHAGSAIARLDAASTPGQVT